MSGVAHSCSMASVAFAGRSKMCCTAEWFERAGREELLASWRRRRLWETPAPQERVHVVVYMLWKPYSPSQGQVA